MALGVPEIEFDVWELIDGKLVVCHDLDIVRIAIHQTGIVQDLTYEEIMLAGLYAKNLKPSKNLSFWQLLWHIINLCFRS